MAKKSPTNAPKTHLKTKKPRSKAASARDTADAPIGVTIRMYCQGLGDCFLLTFATGPTAKPTYVMIDCGVFLNTPGEARRMHAVAENIFDETKGKIDLLIVTHEHWDHISGFSHANDIFAKKFQFGDVWLSWAENPDDPDARAIKADLGKKRSQLKTALGMAQTMLKVAGAADASQLEEEIGSAEGLLGFLGPEAEKPLLGAAANGGRMDLGTTMDWLRQKVTGKNFCNPGERRAVPGADGVHAYVLGPPKGASQLRKMDPTGNQGYSLSGASKSTQLSLFGAMQWAESTDPNKGTMPPGPFEDCFRVDLEAARDDPFFRRHYGFPNDPLADPVATWRRIDHEWLVGGASRLALQLDVGINNTSLALAFELPDGRTLIFPGDAQIGNWLSWGSLKFKVTDKAGRETEITSKDLLNRAVFYKVGHHGSHNATLRVGGLEEMISGDLVAMIPTDQDFATTKHPPKSGWEMPAHGIETALRHFSGGRVIRADFKSNDDLAQEVDDEQIVKSPGWNKFRDGVRFAGEFPADSMKDPRKPMYVEFTIR